MTTHAHGNGIVRFEFSQLPPSFNQMLRMHWAKRQQWKQTYELLIRNQVNLNDWHIIEPCEIAVTWRVMRAMDEDNAKARFKLIGDAMKECGVITDDGPEIIKALRIKQERVRHRNEQGFVMEVQEYLPFTGS